MKRSLIVVAALAAFGCAQVRSITHHKSEAPYQNPFYAKYLNTGSPLDAQITRTLEGLRQDPKSAQLHNELGALLVQKSFPKDAEREFERSIDADGDYYPAWYNLALIRAARGDESGARRAFGRTIHFKPGHAAALFQLGLIEEKLKHTDRAVDLYAKAFRINPSLMDVEVNPRILDTRLIHLALIRMYPSAHAKDSMQFQGVPQMFGARRPTQPATQQQAPSPQANPAQILTPSAPATDPAAQSTPPPPTARRRRQAPPQAQPAPAPAPPPQNPPS